MRMPRSQSPGAFDRLFRLTDRSRPIHWRSTKYIPQPRNHNISQSCFWYFSRNNTSWNVDQGYKTVTSEYISKSHMKVTIFMDPSMHSGNKKLFFCDDFFGDI